MAPRPDLHPGSAETTDLMRRLQDEVASVASFSGSIDIDPSNDVVAGIDQAFPHAEEIVSAAVGVLDGEIIERVHVSQTPSIGYIPGLLAYREGPAAIAAIEELSNEPGMILVDGNGRIHPKQAGLATHLGVVLDRPTIGVAKSLLCGDPAKPLEGLEAGTQIPIYAGDAVTGSPDTVIGYALQTRQFSDESRHINPVIVSPGHRLSAEDAVAVVQSTVTDYKLPFPLHEADRYASQVADRDQPKR